MIKFLRRNEIAKQLKELEKIEIPDFHEDMDANEYDEYADKVGKKLSDIIKFPISITQKVANDCGKSIIFYRARKFEGFKNINLISEYNYPPILFSKSIQRANLPFHPVFYASNHALTTVFEVLQHGYKKGENILISRWRMHDADPFYTTPFLFHGLKPFHPYYKIVQEIKTKGIKEANPSLSEKEHEGIYKILEALSKLFFKSNDFRITASFAHLHLYTKFHSQKTDILIYPSIRTNGLSVNFAIHPNFVDNRVFLEEIYIIKIGKYCKNSGFIKYKLLHYGVMQDSRINWIPYTKEHPEYQNIKHHFKERFKV